MEEEKLATDGDAGPFADGPTRIEQVMSSVGIAHVVDHGIE